ncbi:MAG TPA: C1 family peptidase [Actinomycetota bacterium]|nr:C1 family peptidase [Actinomycetota bacterium]
MADVDLETLRKAIEKKGYSWKVRKVPANEDHALGHEPSNPLKLQQATGVAERMVRARIRLTPIAAVTPEDAATMSTVNAADASIPAEMDWRTRGIIGPVTDQRRCGSCVSFATVGMVAAMAALEIGARDLDLSEADAHFCSSHGVSCGGWNNADALGQLKSRGVVTERSFPYMSAFDSPPVNDPSDADVWKAHCHPAGNRAFHVYKITDYSAWPANFLGLPLPFDLRKFYLANSGPLVCGFTVYEDFDSYGGGVYRHAWGKVRGGHAVMVVGYSDKDQCWICRNSWGTSFGGAAHADGTGAGYFKIGYGEANIDDEPMYGCHGVIAPATLPVVAGVSRSADKMDVFAAGTNHGIYTAAWQPGDAQFRGWWPVAGGVAGPGTSIFGVSRRKDFLDVFAVGTDNGIYTAAWQPGDKNWRGWWRVAGGSAAPGTSVHGVSRSADKLDIFAVGTNHHIFTAAWQPGDTKWRGWWPVQGGIAAPNTSVFAVSRNTDKLDIFCVGTDFGVYTAAWEKGDTTWRGWWRIGTLKVAPGTSVYPVSRSADKLDILAVGQDHGIYTAAWERGDTKWRGWWRIAGGVAAPNTSVYGVSRSQDHLDVFAVGTDHRIYTAAWQPGWPTWHGWWPIANGVAAAGTSVFGVSRSTDHLDVFAVGTDFGIYTAAWQPGWTGWHGWWPVAGGVAEGG